MNEIIRFVSTFNLILYNISGGLRAVSIDMVKEMAMMGLHVVPGNTVHPACKIGIKNSLCNNLTLRNS